MQIQGYSLFYTEQHTKEAAAFKKMFSGVKGLFGRGGSKSTALVPMGPKPLANMFDAPFAQRIPRNSRAVSLNTAIQPYHTAPQFGNMRNVTNSANGFPMGAGNVARRFPTKAVLGSSAIGAGMLGSAYGGHRYSQYKTRQAIQHKLRNSSMLERWNMLISMLLTPNQFADKVPQYLRRS